MMQGDFWFALLLSSVAALATTAGSFLGIAVRRPGSRTMALSLGFSAGVMMFVSFGELLRSSITDIGFLPAVVAFFGGMAVMFLVDIAVPHIFVSEGGEVPATREHIPDSEGPEHGWHEGGHRPRRHRRRVRECSQTALLRTGMLIALGIGIHNLPEGMATFAGAIKSRGLGLAIASAVALHNIPEGLAVAVPVFCATGSRRRAMLWSFLSGAAEVVGAIVAAAVLMPFLTPAFLAVTLAAVAGLMVFISFDELIPGSYSYGHEHLSVAGIAGGMALMALGVWVLT